MEIILSNQLQKYEEILEEINSEFEKSEQLKKEIQRVEDTVTTLKLSLYPCRQKISHVNVKIFDNFADIINLYDADLSLGDIQTYSKCNNCNFLLVEVILTKSFLVKLLEWQLQISVICDGLCNNKIVHLNNRNSVLEIIQIDANIFECVVNTHLFHLSNNVWNIIDLNSVNVDISFFFQSYKEKEVTPTLIDEQLLNLRKLYNKDRKIDCLQSVLLLQNQYKCDFDKSNFVPTFIRNAYHRLNLETFPDFVNDKSVIDVQISINNKKVTILYNKDTHILKLKCSFYEMLLLNKFFLKYSTYDNNEFKRKLKNIISKKNALEEMDLDELLKFVQQLRRLWL